MNAARQEGQSSDMASTQGISQAEATDQPAAKAPTPVINDGGEQRDDDLESAKMSAVVVDSNLTSGTARAEAMQLVWGKHGRLIVWIGISMMLIVYQFDNALLYNYRNYAASAFNNVAGLSTLGVVGAIVFAVAKPPIAKISNTVGRAEAYIFCVMCYLLGYILCASSSSFGVYAGGFVFANIGQTGVNILNDIIISDITTMRARGFGISISFFPFLITPWISAFIVEDVVNPGGIGWRWGIGMFALIMPAAASALILPLMYYQRKAKKQSVLLTQKLTLYEFCSQIDLGGSFLLAAGFTMFLLPFTIAGASTEKWKQGYIIALIVVGLVTLIGLVFYEALIATHPIVPPRYLKNLTIVLCCTLGFLDTFGFSGTHTYLYTWATVVQNMGPRDATFLNYTNGVWQCLTGIISGAIMWKTKRYKWLLVAGAIVKLIGYGLMIRLRGANNSWAEIFVVQSIQGIGAGFLEMIIIVAAQVVVPHTEMPQVTALVLLCTFVGGSVGGTVAGAFYTGGFKDALRHHLGSGVTEDIVDAVYASITSTLIPAVGTAQRNAINLAYSDVLRNITYSAVATSALCVVIALFVPNHRLKEARNLLTSSADTPEGIDETAGVPLGDATRTTPSQTHVAKI